MFRNILFTLLTLLLLVWVSESQAPEITEYDRCCYYTYRVQEDGSLCDRDGIIRGWIHGNTVYDADWNIQYRIHGDQAGGAEKDVKAETT